MEGSTTPDAAPRVVPAPGARRGTAYRLDDSLVAVHGVAEALARDAAVASLEGGEITVLPVGRAPEEGSRLGPVYRVGPGGPIAVPTGRVFVRFSAGTRAEHEVDALAAAGFALESVPGYAPHAAWVRPASGRVTDALIALDRLRGMHAVDAVEPQLVSEAARRA